MRPGIRVLCATDSVNEGLSNSTNGLFFLENALRLRSNDEEAGIQVTSVDSSDLTLEKLNDYDIIVLANVSSPSIEIANRLKTFTENGGGLILFAGENINAEKYGQTFGTTSESILPAIIGNKKTATEENENLYSLDVPTSDHPLATVIRSMSEEMINDAKIKSLVDLQPTQGSQVILSLVENKSPVLVSKEVGNGSVILCSTSADRSWSDMVLHPIYAIMIQQAVTTTTSRPESRVAMVHSSKTINIEGAMPSNAKLQKMIISGEETEDKIETTEIKTSQDNNSFKAEIDAQDINETGVYQITNNEGKILGAIAVNSNPSESNVKVAAADALNESIGAADNIKIIDGSPDTVLNDRKGSDLTSLLLFLCIVCFVLQSILAKIFTNKISKGETDVAASLQLSNVAAARRT